MKNKIFNKVEEKTNVKKEDILNLAKQIQGKDFSDEATLRQIIHDVAKLAGKDVSKEKEDQIVKTVAKDKIPNSLDKLL